MRYDFDMRARSWFFTIDSTPFRIANKVNPGIEGSFECS
jgi:hypothetical protein